MISTHPSVPLGSPETPQRGFYNRVRADLTPSHITEKETRRSTVKALSTISKALANDHVSDSSLPLSSPL